MPLKLVQFFQNPSSAPGGTEKVMERIAEVARDLGYVCDEINESQFTLAVTSRKFTMLNPLGNIVQMSIKARKRLAEADLVISHGIYGPFLRSQRRIHVLHSTHCGTADAMRPHVPRLDYWVARHLYGGVFEQLSCRAERCVAVSDFVREQASSYYKTHCQVIPNTISEVFGQAAGNRRDLRRQLGLPDNRKILMVVGRRERIKGWRVVECLLNELPENLGILSVGSGEAREHDRLIQVSPVAPSSLAKYYAAADWVMSPSLYEGFGLTVLEAWRCGVPVIATPTGVVLELMGFNSDFDRCIADRTGCPRALLAAVRRAIDLDDAGNRQVAWGQELLASRYSQDTFVTNWSEILTRTGKV